MNLRQDKRKELKRMKKNKKKNIPLRVHAKLGLGLGCTSHKLVKE